MSETSADRRDSLVSELQKHTVVAGFWKLREVLDLVSTSAHSSEFSVE